MNRPLIATAVLAAGLLATLTGCASDHTDPKSKTPSPSPSATTGSTAPTATKYNECIDGHATIDASAATKAAPVTLGDCAHVSVVSGPPSGQTVTIGSVEDLLVEASDTEIEVAGAERIVVPGSGNTITYSGASKVDDLGKKNTIAAR